MVHRARLLPGSRSSFSALSMCARAPSGMLTQRSLAASTITKRLPRLRIEVLQDALSATGPRVTLITNAPTVSRLNISAATTGKRTEMIIASRKLGKLASKLISLSHVLVPCRLDFRRVGLAPKLGGLLTRPLIKLGESREKQSEQQ